MRFWVRFRCENWSKLDLNNAFTDRLNRVLNESIYDSFCTIIGAEFDQNLYPEFVKFVGGTAREKELGIEIESEWYEI